MKRRIKIHILSTDIPLKVEDNEEHLYRQAQYLTVQSFEKFRESHPSMTVEELWAHTSFRLALNYCQLLEHNDLNPVLEQIDDLNQQITNLLTDNQASES